ncbi:MAG TPA: BTAD domain-containing putative transcriptional regulator [Burkholderiaceae bacterium]|nr:BTAD domain-containing putative transcriptional regulator [Burkholderiaceae bacterium]
MGPSIYLLGVPRVVRDGSAVALRGHKAWGLLAYLALNRGAVARQRLSSLLFEEAEDPLAALRWNLSEIRRALGDQVLRGDTLDFATVDAGYLDVHVVARGRWQDALAVPGLGRDLLEGLGFAASPAFEVWLNTERRRMHATAQAVLREAALSHLATNEADDAAALASRLVALNPLDENYQVLLVRCLAAAGDGLGAARQAAACRSLFARELGVEPGPALGAALTTTTATATSRPAMGRPAAMAQLEAGEAAIGAGVLEAGLQCLRRAIVDADSAGDPALRARARVALGAALVHAARGRDEEGSASLHEALAIGREAAPVLAAAACRELGYIEFLRSAYDRALTWLDQAEALAVGDRAERARIATVHGAILSDTAQYGAALSRLGEAHMLAEEVGDERQSIQAASMRGRAFLLRGELDAAAATLEPAVARSRQLWTAYLPWPQSFRAELDLLQGRLERAAERFEQAFALACQLGDPCWEGVSGRGLGCVAAARGQNDRAADILEDAVRRNGRLPDAYQWGRAYALEALCRCAVAKGQPRASAFVDQLMTMAGKAGMRELLARGHLHRAALGSTANATAARALASDIDSPSLTRLALYA